MIKLNSPLLKRRYAKERRYIYIANACIICATLFLVGLISSVVWKGWRGFVHVEIQMDVLLDPTIISEDGQGSALSYQRLIKKTLLQEFLKPGGGRVEKKHIYAIVSPSSGKFLRDIVLRSKVPLIGKTISVWLPAGGDAAAYFKGSIDAATLKQMNVAEAHIERLKQLQLSDRTQRSFNSGFFTAGDSRNAETAGIGGALCGSFFTLLLTFFISFPIGVLAAIYLELLPPSDKRLRYYLDIIAININNLAAVPSVIFGLLGLSVFINIFHLPRSSPLVGGLVLSLMTLPTIIISSRAALKAVPPSLSSAALSLGATRMQSIFHHILPAAMPGILTGTIIGMAQALGETAPLLMIGMVAFIVDLPTSMTDAATALPVQIFLWADSPERGFAELTSSAIIVLLSFLIIMNSLAVWLRNKLEIKW